MSSPDFWHYSLGTALGSERVGAEQLVSDFGPVRDGFLERTGFITLYRTPSETTGLDLALQTLDGVPGEWLSENIDGLIFITSTGERSAPGNAHLLQSKLGLGAHLFVLDVNDACTGYVRGLALASSLLGTNAASRVLLVLSDTYSKLYAESDLKVSPLFSDGASAQIISSQRIKNLPMPWQERHWQILGSTFISEGHHADDLTIIRTKNDFEYGELTMNGGGVFNFVVKHLKKAVHQASESAGISVSDVSTWYVHQGSRAVVSAVEKTLGAEEGSLFRSADYGNVVGSALPFQISQDKESAHGEEIIGLAAFGVGLTIGILVIKQFAL